MKPYRSIDMHLDGAAVFEFIAAPAQYLIVVTGLASGQSTLGWNGPSAFDAGRRWREACGGECMISMAEIRAAGEEAMEARDG